MAKRTKTNTEGYEAVMEALEKMGYKSPQSALAAMLGFKGRQGVNNWRKEVPASYAFKVSLLTGVPIETILPETVIEAQAKLKEIAREKAEDRKETQA